ncbi:MAG: FAD-dependent oxidoreductase [Anaerolineae bacterium]|nr:FAD-dependent oxidoreductase [Anaerolineae bacterium]
MTATLGTPKNPLRVAIIGSGPSAFYAAEYLLKQPDLTVQLDMFDRLPTPYGLVRGGVAPDHPKIKTVTRVYERTAQTPGFRFFGHVAFGKDLSHDDLIAHYHAIIYAVGAQSDRHMGIPGEDLPGSDPATEFVGWYNGHPDYRNLSFDLTQTSVAVVGNGNVAMDVARILASTYDELARTDIADYALEALKNSRVRDIYMLGRRGPAQAAFTNPELKEFGELQDAECIVRPEDIELDSLSQTYILSGSDRNAERNVQTLQRYSMNGNPGKSRRIHMRFLVSPTKILGDKAVEAIEIVHNELYRAEDGSLRPRPTDKTETLPVGLVFRSIGYKGLPLPGVPFDQRRGVIPNAQGRIVDPDQNRTLYGEYAVGWIKRGPSGIIGTNKPDAQESVDQLLADFSAGKLLSPSSPLPESLEALLRERGVDFITFDDWLKLDAIEQERGAAQNRPRVKFTTVESMLDAIHKAKTSAD